MGLRRRALGRLTPAFRLSLLLGSLGLLLSALGLLMGGAEREQFYFSWLTALFAALGIALGALLLRLWRSLLRAPSCRVTESLSKLLPVLALLSIPLASGIESLYPWLEPGALEQLPSLAGARLYLNQGLFLGRSLACFAFWLLLLSLLPRLRRWPPVWSGLALLLLLLSFALISFDWIMSMDLRSAQALLPFLLLSAALLGCYGAALLLSFLSLRPLKPKDSSGVILALLLSWGGLSLIQYGQIFYRGLVKERAWYFLRLSQGWNQIASALLLSLLLLPLFLLFLRSLSRARHRRILLLLLAPPLLLGQALHLQLQVMPMLHPKLNPHWLDLSALLGIAGLCGAILLDLLRQPPYPEPEDA